MSDYGDRQTQAARRVLIDIYQVLGSYRECMVLVGGWVPGILLNGDPPHSGSIDVDLALDVPKLRNGMYAELINGLLGTGRYKKSEKSFRLFAEVSLGDGQQPLKVDVDFLKQKGIPTGRKASDPIKGFRPLDADGCATAFNDPVPVSLSGRMINGSENTVKLLDAYDIYFCLENYEGGIKALADRWKIRLAEKAIRDSLEILGRKFSSPTAHGPVQIVEFFDADGDEAEMLARRAFELVDRFLSLVK